MKRGRWISHEHLMTFEYETSYKIVMKNEMECQYTYKFSKSIKVLYLGFQGLVAQNIGMQTKEICSR